MTTGPARLRHGRFAAVLVAGSLLASACSADDGPGVGVAQVSASLAFGSAADEPVAAPANFNPAPVAPARTRAPLELPDAALPPLPGGASFTPTTPLTTRCPEATVDEFPDVGASAWEPDDEKALPRPGLYRWQRSGTLVLEGTGVETEIGGFERRLVRNVEVEDEELDDDGRRIAVTFTYETVQPEVTGSNLVVTAYRVRSDAEVIRVDSPVDDQEAALGEPDRGLALVGIDVVDQHGNVVDQFAPVEGLLLLPLEVVVGEQFQSVALDTRSGQQMTLEGQVAGRERIDACGDIVEGWRVEATVSSAGGDTDFVREYEYVVAPQYGAVLVAERIREEGVEGLHLDFTLGQQDPDALPEGGA